ncbi:MAG: YggS family pyridoxal phosphate-dependent enzyme [Syntrophomonas sp.]|nr:YggS family pyridoxal phosphate-dependent enzyme [Syntrophomonas sp.]
MQKIKYNLEVIKNKIEQAAFKSGRKASEVTLVAVSKTVDIEAVKRAHNMGINDFGENRVNELLLKRESLPGLNWHLIGRLQTNKVKDIVGRTTLIHSLDRWKLAQELDKRGIVLGEEVPVLIQLNVSGEEQKAGFEPGELREVLAAAGQFKALRIYGLMTMAPLDSDPERARPIFRELFQLRQKFSDRNYRNVNLKYLSMGMSQDFAVAIEEGANLVRIGSALFH